MKKYIPAGQCHTLEVLEPDTVIFEVKDGSYVLHAKNNGRRYIKPGTDNTRNFQCGGCFTGQEITNA